MLSGTGVVELRARHWGRIQGIGTGATRRKSSRHADGADLLVGGYCGAGRAASAEGAARRRARALPLGDLGAGFIPFKEDVPVVEDGQERYWLLVMACSSLVD
jgi:hypothetical protein